MRKPTCSIRLTSHIYSKLSRRTTIHFSRFNASYFPSISSQSVVNQGDQPKRNRQPGPSVRTPQKQAQRSQASVGSSAVPTSVVTRQHNDLNMDRTGESGSASKPLIDLTRIRGLISGTVSDGSTISFEQLPSAVQEEVIELVKSDRNWENTPRRKTCKCLTCRARRSVCSFAGETVSWTSCSQCQAYEYPCVIVHELDSTPMLFVLPLPLLARVGQTFSDVTFWVESSQLSK
ncbi:hypothetical protein EJ08DRAFT_23912 [Tothia fuscella]|uniref:Zn(2)-C6 fungal-type domain-containing protein n=1 Tax=Tothia fuscella TaxID=1048955 RepID=A0A9P4NZR8_9PEZI|nr:hypothetical protein EJ08DRAFT_23912 [Tothia fuscella]